VAVELRLLARVAYREQEISGSRLRGLLALLAGDLRSGCSTARLVDGLWPDEQPENPGKALQVLVFRARTQLGSGTIVTTPNGYRLALDADQVDAAAVLVRAAASAQQARAGDHAAALAHAAPVATGPADHAGRCGRARPGSRATDPRVGRRGAARAVRPGGAGGRPPSPAGWRPTSTRTRATWTVR
jgi:hypothetical protein